MSHRAEWFGPVRYGKASYGNNLAMPRTFGYFYIFLRMRLAVCSRHSGPPVNRYKILPCPLTVCLYRLRRFET